ncbi:hypothetical protein B0T26DRAFT_31232 [Lasiosphaeria miniovina]|uniref:Uncharacterized protein n=1 Tax=Lasiosphaeria miniovina TaxID=1954250 RepID=A0AA40ECV8_9PEZI|nr:uncharacterized protein B0T26DRAFT_31232 [Lasiosphaeria miniovina]KAK0733657.1 hypothetical protein B0T26DRAFT_31232 [Lasiosphaeria miniovina]
MPQPRDAGDSGIRIRRETIITIDGENSSLGPEESTRTTIKSGAMDTHLQQQYGRPKAFRKLSNASSIISDIFRHPDTTEDLLRWKIKRANDRDASRELIDFLRNTPPPLNNFMSIPDTYGRKPEPKRKRHPFFWALRKKLGMARAECNAAASPGLIRLPDSAVAGRTIGGHRHIAISIPIEHAHLSPVLRPIEYNWTRPSSPTVETQGLARLNLDRSVVSVLEPVDENRESIESQSGTGTPVIPPISQDMFSLLLDPGESLESPATDLTVPSTEEMPRELNPLHSRTADASTLSPTYIQ